MRPSRDQMFMAMARAAAMRATCFRLNVGAVIVYDRNVEAIGYNGAPSGEPHCTGNGCKYFAPSLGCQVVHAERNAISRVYSWKTAQVYTMYVTHSPCAACAEMMVTGRDPNGDVVMGGGFRRVVFETPYRDPKPVQRLIDAGVGVFQLLPSGLLIDQGSNTLCESQ